MKRGITGGTHRGPVGMARQRRAVGVVQVLLVLIAAGLLMFAGYSLGVRSGFEAGRRAGELGAPQPPSAAQAIILAALGVGALAAASMLRGPEGPRVPSPARLNELAGRAEATAVDRAGRASSEQARAAGDAPGRDG